MNDSIIILVVDDNHENLKVVSNFLKEAGYKIALALDGNSALNVLENNKIDLILLDIMMPGMDGFEVCKKIREKEAFQNIPVIFLTAKANTNDIVKGFNMGGADYVTKPFNREELLSRVKTHIDLSQSNKKLIDIIKTRDKLYSIIIHDIRSPFTNITILINSIADGTIDTSSEKFKEIMRHIGKSMNDTNTMLNNLLEWIKLQTGSINIKLRKIPLVLVLNNCVQLLEGIAKEKNISIEMNFDSNPIANLDEITMNTIIRNILTNAIKFTPENGKISIHTETSKDMVSILIKDNGIGIPKGILDKLINENEMYTSLGTKREKGTGIGLQLIKDLIKLNNGTFEIESIENIGTTFKINIPSAI